jgi:hypothetical protein
MVMDMFTANELASMQATQKSAMMDECLIISKADLGTDPYGMPVESYPDTGGEGTTSVCGLNMDPKGEAMGDTQVSLIDARLRLPIGTEISRTDRIRITKRFGLSLEDTLLFKVMGEPRRGPSGLVVDLKRVTTGES